MPYSNIKWIEHEGVTIGGVHYGRWVVVATYVAGGRRSVILERDTREECEEAIQWQPWKGVIKDIEYVEGV